MSLGLKPALNSRPSAALKGMYVDQHIKSLQKVLFKQE